MPKPGFKCLTISEDLYDRNFEIYTKTKDELLMKGISGFSAFIVHRLNQCIQQTISSCNYQPKIEEVSIYDDRIILLDNRIDRIAEIKIIDKKLHCNLCTSDHCSHIGFCYSLHEIYDKIGDIN